MNIYDFASMYEDLGVNYRNLGCVMLDVEPIPIEQIVPAGYEDQLWFSPKEFPWAQGAVGANTGHVTLKYGFLTPPSEQEDHVYHVLGNVIERIPTVRISHVGVFKSPKRDTDPYACIVGHVDAGFSEEDLPPGAALHPLREANLRLSMLPHIDSYASYRAHVTLAYVHEDHAEEWRSRLNAAFAGRELRVTGLNLGDD